MLNLESTDKISLITSSTADIDVIVSYVDIVTSTEAVTADKQLTAITSATTTDICAAPSAGTVRNVKGILVKNKHASTSNTVTPQINVSGTLYELAPDCILLFGESLTLNADGTWFHYDDNGGVYGQDLPAASDTVVGGIEIATQAELETGTDNTLAVTPGRVKYHQGVAKAVMFTTGTATPVAQTPPTYNCTLTDSGVGRLTVNFTTAFSATTAYTVQTNCEVISTTLTAAANVMQTYMRFGGQAAAGSCEVNCCDRTATTNVIRDPISWHVVAYGDQ